MTESQLMGRGPSGFLEATFAAEILEDAMALARRALGPQAVILASRRVEEPGRAARFEIRAAATGTLDDDFRELALPSARVRCVPPGPRSLLERVLRAHDLPGVYARDLALCERVDARTMGEVRVSLGRLLRERVTFGRPAMSERVTAVMGPAGSGKSTTTGKLAAREALTRKVSWITLDEQRRGPSEDSRRLARQAGASLGAAHDATSLAAELRNHAGADRIFIDTHGGSPRGVAAVLRLASGLAGVCTELLLCVSAAVGCHEMLRTFALHAPIEPRALAITKLDEAHLAGAAVFAAVAGGVRVAYLSAGARVPEDLEQATADRLVELLRLEERSL